MTPEADFATWRRRGDAQALGRVFDVLAPQLLLVAAHLAGGSNAEDLVQATFVDAIAQKDRWDERRPLAPWLVGILGNHVRRELRRRQRQQVPDPRRLPGSEAPDPADEAQANELAEAVRLAVARLPVQHHQVLSLRFVHGLELQQIAHSLRLPLGTVKTRLYRGLALLKRALPAGLAGTLAVTLTPGRGLAAVRAAVLGHASAAAGAAVGTAGAAVASGMLIGAMTMKKVAVALVALLLLAGGWLAFRQGSPPVQHGVTSAQHPQVADAPSPAAPLSRTETVPTQPPDNASAPGHKTEGIVILAVDDATGAPIESYGLRASEAPDHNMMAAEIPLLHAGTHAGGRLLLEEAAFAQRTFLLEDSAQHYLPSRWFSLTDAVEREGARIIVVKLAAPVDVTVTVVHEHGGAAVAGTRVELVRPWIKSPEIKVVATVQAAQAFRIWTADGGFAQWMGGRGLLLSAGTTDADGKVHLRSTPGEALALRLLGPGHRPAVHQPWSVPAGPGPLEVTETVTTGAAIRGRVVPPEALTQLRPELPKAAPQGAPQFLAQMATGLRLQHTVTGEVVPPGPAFVRLPKPLADDGTFAIDGLHAGDWRLIFCYPLRLQSPEVLPSFLRKADAAFMTLNAIEVELPPITDLHDHELRVFDIDVSALLPGRLEATVTRAGQRVSDGVLYLRHAPDATGMRVTFRSNAVLRFDSEGRVVAALPPGHYTVDWRREGDASAVMAQDFEIRSGATTSADLVLGETVRVELRVVQADGVTPARGALTLVLEENNRWDAQINTDANGAAIFAEVPRGIPLRAIFKPAPAQGPAPTTVAEAAKPKARIDLGVLPPFGDQPEVPLLKLPPR